MNKNSSALPKISIVTPSYNQGQYIEETIRSVQMQNYPNLEYIIMDGGSTDQTVEVIQRYEDFITYWVSEPDKGQANAINKGFRQSTGEIMGWLNSDDLLLPGALFHIAEAFQRQPEVMVVTGLRKVYNSQSEFLHNWFDAIPTEEVLRIRCSIAQEATYWRREVWEKVGEIDEFFQYTMDYEYWQRVLDAGYRFTLLPRYIGGFRVHSSSKGTTLNHVRDQELSRLYQQRGIAQNEAEAFQKLDQVIGKNWETLFYLIWRLCQRPISNSAPLVIAAYRLLRMPVIGSTLVGIYKRLRR